jgi:hypothetical protein
MSEIINCDPARGFVAFPVALFDLELSPGAFRTLAELCRMANLKGQCWPSLAQLGKRLGRSKASVSAYITELRNADVLRTEEQKMANGYNYRLRYTVTFWENWRAELGRTQARAPRTQAPQTKRSVQPAVRPLETKNHIHKKHDSRSEISGLLSEWKKIVGKAAYPGFEIWPSILLLDQTERALTGTIVEQGPPISADIDEALRCFLVDRGLVDTYDPLGAALAPVVKSVEHLNALLGALDAGWQTHWRKAPNKFQILRLLGTLAPLHDHATEHKLLQTYLRRWKLHVRSLPSGAIRSNVAA